MQEKLDNYLVEKYPKIFINRYEGPMVSNLCFGFEHNDGWFWILDQLCDSIQNYIDTNNKYNETKVAQVVATQVKEKFGSLNFYYSGGNDYIDGMVRLAENMSQNVCEFCGSSENIGYTKGWIYTICKDCHENGEDRVHNLKWTEADQKKNEISKELRKIKLDKINKSE